MYLEVWMQLAIVLTFGCCALFSYRVGESRGRLGGGIDTLDLLRKENIITIDEKGIIRPKVVDIPKKRSSKRTNDK